MNRYSFWRGTYHASFTMYQTLYVRQIFKKTTTRDCEVYNYPSSFLKKGEILGINECAADRYISAFNIKNLFLP